MSKALFSSMLTGVKQHQDGLRRLEDASSKAHKRRHRRHPGEHRSMLRFDQRDRDLHMDQQLPWSGHDPCRERGTYLIHTHI